MAEVKSGVSTVMADEDGPNTTPTSSVSSGELSIDIADIAVTGYGCRVPDDNNFPPAAVGLFTEERRCLRKDS